MQFIKTVLLGAACLLTITLHAERMDMEKSGTPQPNNQEPSKAYKTLVADCDPSFAQVELNINNIRTTLRNGGDKWWDGISARYEAPKIPDGDSRQPAHSLFAGAVWVSGLDEGNNLKIAAQTYRQTGNDFWAGPLNSKAEVDKATCAAWDQHFTVYGGGIKLVRAEFEKQLAQGNASVSKAIIENLAPDMLRWPGLGNPHLLLSDNLLVNSALAPFFDYDADGIYDPTKGDYPVIDDQPRKGLDKVTFADQMIFWVYNDAGNIHTETQGDAIGMQFNALAFAYKTSDEINDMTFYKYKMVNKSGSNLKETFMGQWVDPDLGCASNDYVGVDTTRDMGFVYGGEAVDNPCNGNGYLQDVPILGIDFFEGPIDTSGKELGMSSFIYYNNDFSAQGNPRNASDFRNYMTGKWIDGNIIECGGDGYLQNTAPCPFMFPSDPCGPGWSEVTENNPLGDRRWLQNSGPFLLPAGAVQNITIGVVWRMLPPGSHPNVCVGELLGTADDKAQALFDNSFDLIDGPDAPTLNIRELDQELIITFQDLEASNNKNESYDEVDPLLLPQIAALVLAGDTQVNSDSTYTFQGYKLYQVANSSVSAADLEDETQAKLILQCDIRDGISDLTNWTFNEQFGGFSPELKVTGNDQGVVRSIRITQDLFATGQSELVNHKTYYFTVIAYAENNFREFDPLRPRLGGQTVRFLQGRNNVANYSAIPHKMDPRNMGTVLNAEYGEGLEVTRMEGQGNGGFSLELTESTVDAILSSPDHYVDEIVYQALSAPIAVKVVDPLLLRDADFQFRFITGVGDTSQQALQLMDSTTWMIIVDGGADTIFAPTLDYKRNYEQLLISKDGVNYGLSLSVGAPLQVNLTTDDQAPVYSSLNSSMTFEDDIEGVWMGLILDETGGITDETNWIRSGNFIQDDNNDPIFNIYNAHFDGPVGTPRWYDEQVEFSGMLSGGMGPYALASMFAEPGRVLDGNNEIRFCNGPAFYTDLLNEGNNPTHNYPDNTLDELPSIQLVLTADQDNWTKCVVFETGESRAFNNNTINLDFNSSKGDIKLEYSRDKNGNIIGAPLSDQTIKDVINQYGGDIDLVIDELEGIYGKDLGRSWFPGYAINLETGERLNIAFGEATELAAQNGSDMIWNPTDKLYSPADVPINNILFGGKHFIYVFKSRYDECDAYQATLLDNYGKTNRPGRAEVYRDIMWTGMPYLNEGFQLLPMDQGLVPGEVQIRLRVEKPYQRFTTSNTSFGTRNTGLPVYTFSTSGLQPEEQSAPTAESALDLIRAVPNPYFAYSAYEQTQVDNTIKIINLPNECTVSIFSLDGQLINRIERNVGANSTYDIADGTNVDDINLTNAVEWNLQNFTGVPIAGGVYIIHVNAPGIGEKTVKWFGALRPTDTSSF